LKSKKRDIRIRGKRKECMRKERWLWGKSVLFTTETLPFRERRGVAAAAAVVVVGEVGWWQGV
jgi:hypothetical protein